MKRGQEGYIAQVIYVCFPSYHTTPCLSFGGDIAFAATGAQSWKRVETRENVVEENRKPQPQQHLTTPMVPSPPATPLTTTITNDSLGPGHHRQRTALPLLARLTLIFRFGHLRPSIPTPIPTPIPTSTAVPFHGRIAVPITGLSLLRVEERRKSAAIAAAVPPSRGET